MKTLYLSDLDGTLIRNNQRISNFTTDVIAHFVKEGGLFSYATARSPVTSKIVTNGLNVGLPLICHDGASIYDEFGEEILLSHHFLPDEITEISNVLAKYDFYPIVNAFIDGYERFSYFEKDMDKGMVEFLNDRKNDPRIRIVSSFEELYFGEIFSIYFIRDDKGDVAPLNDLIKNDGRFHTILQKDTYHDYWFFVLLPAKASKANAALELKKMLGCDRLVVFGDRMNDLSMFAVADESYAMSNAVDELKAIATGVIGSNEDDAVAKWILTNVMK